MSEQQGEGQASAEDQHVVIVGPDGAPIGTMSASELARATGGGSDADDDSADTDGPDGAREPDETSEARALTDLVEQPAKVMRIGSMIRQLLEEVKAAPLDEASRVRLKEIHHASIIELEAGLAPELVEELERLSLPFTEDGVPSDAELRIAQAQLVGWLEGLFHGIQTAIYAQQVAAKAQFEQMRRALPPGGSSQGGPGHGPAQPRHPGQPGGAADDSTQPGGSGGMYL